MSSEATNSSGSEYAIEVTGLGKCYQIYDKPSDRLKQMLMRGRKQYYKEFWALKDVSFKIKKGETVGIIGRNGSGKSTLLQMICGTLNPTAGEVKVNGRVAALLELGAGFNPEFSGVENVYMAASLYGLSKEEVAQRFEAIATFADIGDHIHQPVKTYSSGMYARLGFSVVVHVSPDILIIDEALAVGDARFVAKCMKQIEKLKENGCTIFFVSHDIASIRSLCQNVIWLHKGYIKQIGDVFSITGRYTEYIFSDEVDVEGLSQSSKNNLAGEMACVESENVAIDSESHSRDATSTLNGIDYSVIRVEDAPLAHWGSHKGMVVSVELLDHFGFSRRSFEYGENLLVKLELKVPTEMMRDKIVVSISIKDLKGTDLIVATTHDFEYRKMPEEEHFEVLFEMINYLAAGKYLMVVAVEERSVNGVHYFEYLEGVRYFESHSGQKFFGIFRPAVKQKVKVH